MGNSKSGGNGRLSLIVGDQTDTLNNNIINQPTSITPCFQRALSACGLRPVQEADHA